MSRPPPIPFLERWALHLENKSDPVPLLKDASDEELVHLIERTAARGEEYDSALLRAEILDRLARRQTDPPSGAAAALRSAKGAYVAAIKGQAPIHAANRILEAQGDATLGKAVAASGTSSLDATKLAFESAQEHSGDVSATQAQTRVNERLAVDAEQTARRASMATEDLESKMAASGHPAEGRAADEAALDILAAAKVASEDARKDRLGAEGRRVPGKEIDAT